MTVDVVTDPDGAQAPPDTLLIIMMIYFYSVSSCSLSMVV